MSQLTQLKHTSSVDKEGFKELALLMIPEIMSKPSVGAESPTGACER